MRIALLLPPIALALSGCGAHKLVLPEDLIGTAATCGVVAAANARVGSAAGGQQVAAALPLDRQTQIVHYALLAGASDEQFSRDKAAAVMAEMQAIQEKVTEGKWKDLVQPCAAAFPETDLARPITLPADPVDAQLGCYVLGKFMMKALSAQGNAYEDALVKYGALGRELDQKVAVGLNNRGIRSEKARDAARDKALSKAAKLGSPAKVLDACSERYVKA